MKKRSYEQVVKTRKYMKCPKCKGKSVINNGSFYHPSDEECNVCRGKGMVVEKETFYESILVKKVKYGLVGNRKEIARIKRSLPKSTKRKKRK